MKTVQNAESAKDLAAPATQPSASADQLMDVSNTPESKSAAFKTLFYLGTDETLTQAVDYLYEDPALFSKTVQELSSVTSHKATLKAFLKKMGDTENRVRPFIRGHFEASLQAKNWAEYTSALTPFFALKDTFEGVDKNRRASSSCPSACDLLRSFTEANDCLNREYGPLMFKKLTGMKIAGLDLNK